MRRLAVEGGRKGGIAIMIKRIGLIALGFALMGAADPQPLATQRHVAGVITSIDTKGMTIASAQSAVTGKIDPQRTKVTDHGRPASLGDLKLTAHAKGELCLDDVWLAIDLH